MAKKAPGYQKQLILAVTLCVLGMLAYWLEYAKKPQDEAKKGEDKKVFRLKDEKISKFELEGKTEKSSLNIALECASLKEGLCKTDTSSKWEMTSPLKTKADDNTVNSLLKNVGNLASSDVLDLKTETAEKRAALLKDYGISETQRKDPATRKLRFTLASGKKLAGYFGVKNPISDGVFSLLETDGKADETTIYLVPEWQIAIFDQKTSYLRDKRLFGMNEKDVSAFTVRTSKKLSAPLSGKKDAAGKWTVKFGGVEASGDSDVIEGVLAGVSFFAAKDFIAEKKDSPEGKQALKGAKLVYDLDLTLADGKKHLRLFEKLKDPKKPADGSALYATVEDQDPLFEIDRFATEKVDRGYLDFRVSKLIPASERFSFSEITVELKGKNPFLQKVIKDAGAWKTDGKTVVGGRMETILDRLTSQLVTKFEGPAPSGDQLTFSFQTGGKLAGELLFWKTGGKIYARDLKAAKPETYELMSDFASQLPWDARFLIDESLGPNER